jgi:hypothetical protein
MTEAEQKLWSRIYVMMLEGMFARVADYEKRGELVEASAEEIRLQASSEADAAVKLLRDRVSPMQATEPNDGPWFHGPEGTRITHAEHQELVGASAVEGRDNNYYAVYQRIINAAKARGH